MGKSQFAFLGAIGLGAALLSPVVAVAEVVVALAIPATGGQIAALGAQARLGAEAAVEAINARGGINGERIALRVVDDQCDPRSAVAAANQIASRGIRFVLGHLCSGASIAASKVYEEEGVLMLTGSATAPDLTERGLKMIFRACGRHDQQGVVGARFVTERLKPSRVAVVHDRQVYGKGLAEKAEAIFREAGLVPLLSGSINAGERDYTALVTRLKQDDVEVVYFGGYHTELGLLVRQARQAGVEARFVGGDGLASSEYWALAGDGAAGTLFTFSPDPKSTDAGQRVYQAMKPRGEPDNFSFYYYAATQVLAQAISAGGPSPSAVATILREREFDTVVGKLRFNAQGDLTDPKYVVYEWADGKYAASQR